MGGVGQELTLLSFPSVASCPQTTQQSLSTNLKSNLLKHTGYSWVGFSSLSYMSMFLSDEFISSKFANFAICVVLRPSRTFREDGPNPHRHRGRN